MKLNNTSVYIVHIFDAVLRIEKKKIRVNMKNY